MTIPGEQDTKQDRYEKYADELKEYKGLNFCKDFVKPNILESEDCDGVSCDKCRMCQLLWLLEDYEEPEVNWNKVEVDTPILVRCTKDEEEEWMKRHFAKYENGIVYAWRDRYTSWTVLNNEDVTAWKYAKLAEDEKKGKEPEVDWNKVEVDTPILVKEYEDGEWVKRYFAKYIAGKVYAWNGGRTGQIESHVTPWRYAKLAESEEK